MPFSVFNFLNFCKKEGRRVSTPTLLQMEATECGAASLGIILSYYGLWLPLEKLRAVCGVNRDGSSLGAISRAAKGYGLEVHGYRWRMETLIKNIDSYPLIIHWEFSHFLVLEGIIGDTAYLNDPAIGHRKVSLTEFRSSFTGIVLSIKPGKDFKKFGKPFSAVGEISKKLWRDKWATFFLLLTGIFLIVPGLAFPVMQQIFLDDILTGLHEDWMFNLMLGMGAGAVVSAILTWLRSWCLTRWQARLVLVDSAAFFHHLLDLPMHFFHQRFASEIASRVNFHKDIASVLSDSAATALLDLAVAVFYLLLLFQYSVSLTVIGLFFSIINIFVYFSLHNKLTELSMRIGQDSGKEYGTAINGLMMIETIKANGSEADFLNRWIGYRTKALNGFQQAGVLSQTVTMLPLLLGGVNTALIMTFGGWAIMDGLMSAGIFMAFQHLMSNFGQPVNRLLGLSQTLQNTKMQMQRLNDVYAYEPDSLNILVGANEETNSKSRFSGHLTLKNVNFGYSPLKPPLIKDFSLDIKPGHWAAVVGASGSGKSTVAKLVTGLYEEWSGEVLFDGVKRRDWPRRVIVNSLSSVDQEIFLLSGTIRENITLFDPSIRSSDIESAAADACILDDILRLNGGYEGKVQSGGFNFSGGQRQRLEIARALAVNPSLLVLDEATSALDPVTEEKILTNIRRRGCTCLIVAHRLSTIRDADEILVLENGIVTERGCHDELIAMNGTYAKLVGEDQRRHDM